MKHKLVKAQILAELKAITGNQALTEADILTWSPYQLRPGPANKIVYLGKLHLYVETFRLEDAFRISRRSLPVSKSTP